MAAIKIKIGESQVDARLTWDDILNLERRFNLGLPALISGPRMGIEVVQAVLAAAIKSCDPLSTESKVVTQLKNSLVSKKTSLADLMHYVAQLVENSGFFDKTDEEEETEKKD